MEKNEIEIEFFDRVRRRNAPKASQKRFFISFFIIFLLALVFGGIFCHMSVRAVSNDMKKQIISHFCDVFLGCETLADYFAVIISCAGPDLRYLLLIFTAGFTYFCKYAAGAMVAVRAFTVGFCSEFLLLCLKDDIISLKYPFLSFALFAASEICMLALIMYLSVKAVLFGDDFRRLRGRRSLMLRSPVIYRYIFLFLTAIGFVIIINAAYCFISSLI